MRAAGIFATKGALRARSRGELRRRRGVLVGLALMVGSVGAMRPAGAEPAQSDANAIVPPRQLAAPPVAYPEHATGDETVVLELEIDQDGNVAATRAREGAEPFASAARQGVLGWRFTPAMRGGMPVRARILVEIRFTEPRPTIPALPPSEPESATSEDDDVVDEIRVLGARRQEIGSTYVPREDARKIPGTFSDPFRVTEVMPGVAPVLSGIPYFFVRGAPPGNVGYLIDGIRVPLLFHVGAGPSILAPALVDRVDFLPSAYPARLGRYAGAIVSGETMAPSNVARGEFQARVFDSSGMIEVPFGDDRGSVLVAARYAYTQPVLDVVAPEYRLEYWDYQARFGYRFGRQDTVSVFAFGASDLLENQDLGVTLFDTQFHRIDVRWDHSSATNRTRAGVTLARDRVQVAEEGALGEGSELETEGIRLRIETQERVSESLVLRAGIEYETELVENEQNFGAVDAAFFPERVDLAGTVHMDLVARPLSFVEVVPGIRLNTGVWRDDTYFFPEPRLATRIGLGGGAAWVSTFGRVHQLPTQTVRIPGRRADTLEYSVQESWQAAQGLELVLPSSMLGKLTLFHSWIDAEQRDYSGRNYGLEVSLRRDFSERLGGFVSYTLSRTELTTGSETFQSEFDKPHLLSVAIGYDFGAGFRLGWRAYYASGQRFAVGCGASSTQLSPDPDFPCRSGRLPDFLRLDTRFEKRWTFDSGAWVTLNFEWFNATISREASEVIVLPNGSIRPGYQPALTLPSVGIEAGF